VKTLIVNCYRERAREKIGRYLELAARYSEPYEVPWDACGPGYRLESFSAVVISGSQWLLSKEAPTPALTEFVKGLNVPTLGICFGHQLLARAHGAGVLSGELVERPETIAVDEPTPLFSGLGEEFEMTESHREYVDYCAIERAGWRVLAHSASCPVEAIQHPTRPLLGVQFHPERSGPDGETLLGNFYRLFVRPRQDERPQHS
jgi:GMP synthase-like glutamine amidotransferase